MEEVNCMTMINWNVRIYDDNPCCITLLLNIKQRIVYELNQVLSILSSILPLKHLP